MAIRSRYIPCVCLLLSLSFISACTEPDTDPATLVASGRWYDAGQQELGATVFAQYCAQCHGDAAQGLVADWRQKLDDGSFPPPPLNGSAHAWHHPLSVLLQVIDQGGAEFGGKMPAFADILSAEQKLAAIAYFQSFWNDETYQQWQQMGGSN